MRNEAGPCRFIKRSKVNFTSLDSTGEPSENTASGSSVKVNDVKSSLLLHSVARRGRIVLGSSGSTVTSVS